jgi:two-component system, OmpR family, sensor histidine kinase KdpD
MLVLPIGDLSRTPDKQIRLPRLAGLVSLRLGLSLAFIAAITFICFRLIHVNATTVGFAYLVGILLVATAWGLLEATVASVAAMLCFNYFFFPPVGTFTVADPQNWVALFAFLTTSITASQLSSRAKRRTKEAVERQREMERLYALSRAILLTDTTQPIAKQIAHEIARTFDFPGLAIFDRSTGEIHRAGPEDIPEVDDKLRETAVQGTQFQDDTAPVVVTAIRLGGQPIGSLVIKGAALSDTALQSLSNLVAVGLERVRGQETVNRAEAARQSEELKSTLLDAIAHEFKTPLTSIKAAAGALLADPATESNGQRELVTIVDEEADRLARLVTDAIQMARIEGGKLQLNRGLHSASFLISRALQQVKPFVEGREVRVLVPESLPLVSVDAELIQLAIRQIIDNALKYSNPTTPIKIGARVGEKCVILSVSDQGPGIAEEEQARIFEKFYRSARDRHLITGTGMGLTIAREILRAHGGDVGVRSSPVRGSEFYLSLPVVSQERAV